MLSTNFVKAHDRKSTYANPVPAPLFRKNFTLTDAPNTAELTIGAAGFYELWVNGQNITKGLCAPYISNPDDYVYFDRYDVAPHLQPGTNVIGVMLGNGFQNLHCPIWDFDQARHNGPLRFALELRVDGEPILDATSFMTKDSPILLNDYRSGVHYDARLADPAWCTPDGIESSSPNPDGATTDRAETHNNTTTDRAEANTSTSNPANHAWRPALPAETPRGKFKLCEANPIRVYHERAPITQKPAVLHIGPMRSDVAAKYQGADLPASNPPATGGYLYDFGVNTAGIYRLQIKAQPGQVISLQFAERLVDGKVDPTNISFFYPDGYGQRDIYIASGAPEGETYEPSFAYYGYRYIYVSGISEEQATPELLTCLEATSIGEATAHFSSSDPTINRLWDITERSDKSNFYYFPTDCPHREKNGWTGDASLSSERFFLAFDVKDSMKEWLRNLCAAQAENGALPGIVPTGGWGFDWGNGPGWDSALFFIPYYAYLYTGDLSLAELAAPSMLRYLSYISGKRDANGTVAIGLGDWCPVGREADDYKMPLALSDSIFVYLMAERAAFMYERLHMDGEYLYAKNLAMGMRRAIREHLFDAETALFAGSCQSSQAVGIYAGLCEPEEEDRAFQHLLELIAASDEHMDVGIFGGRVLFHVLAQHGEVDLALKMITQKTYPSYGNLLERGATSLWEMFLPEGQLSGSENHHFWGDINHWFVRYLGGIHVNPQMDDPDHIEIAPRFPRSLDSAEASYRSPGGEVHVSWKRVAEHIELHVRREGNVTLSYAFGDRYTMLQTAPSTNATQFVLTENQVP